MHDTLQKSPVLEIFLFSHTALQFCGQELKNQCSTILYIYNPKICFHLNITGYQQKFWIQ